MLKTKLTFILLSCAVISISAQNSDTQNKTKEPSQIKTHKLIEKKSVETRAVKVEMAPIKKTSEKKKETLIIKEEEIK